MLKQLRQNKGYKLTDMSKITGYTPSFLSQLERGLKQPSLEALRKISECLDIPMITFFIEDNDKSPCFEENFTSDSMYCSVIRKNNRKKFGLQGLSSSELLTPHIEDSLNKPEIMGLYVETKPGCWTSEKMVSHNYDENIFIIKGEMQAYVGDKVYMIKEGDSLYIRKNAPHNLLNSGKEILICTAHFSTNIF